MTTCTLGTCPHPRKKCGTISGQQSLPVPPPSPRPPTTTSLLSVSVDAPVLSISHQWNPTTRGPVWLASLTQHPAFEAHPWPGPCHALQSFFWLNHIPLLRYTSFCASTHRLPDIGVVFCLFGCCEHWCVSARGGEGFISLEHTCGSGALGHVLLLWWTFLRTCPRVVPRSCTVRDLVRYCWI